MAQVSSYLSLVSSQHQQAPRFLSFLTIFLKGQVDNQNLLATFPRLFDIDYAVGQQLDCVGVRVGQIRNLPGYSLNDTDYRHLLRGVIAANVWDGTAPGAYTVWAAAFGANQYLLQDYKDMSMLVVDLTNRTSLIPPSLLALKPAAVNLIGFYRNSIVGIPVFGLDVDNATVGGLDHGAFVAPVAYS